MATTIHMISDLATILTKIHTETPLEMKVAVKCQNAGNMAEIDKEDLPSKH